MTDNSAWTYTTSTNRNIFATFCAATDLNLVYNSNTVYNNIVHIQAVHSSNSGTQLQQHTTIHSSLQYNQLS